MISFGFRFVYLLVDYITLLHTNQGVSLVWNHGNAVYGIKPQENARWRVMPYAYGDSILTYGEIPYQSFGLDKKERSIPFVLFLCVLTLIDDVKAMRLKGK